jgi:hypothetical protein
MHVFGGYSGHWPIPANRSKGNSVPRIGQHDWHDLHDLHGLQISRVGCAEAEREVYKK